MALHKLTKLRAVGYNRVSTDELVQLDALQVQIQETKECVEKMGWTMVDQYIDEGKSGTGTKKRDEYKRLYNDLFTDNFDVVVIKSQDRLMRNTKDWYIFIDALVTNNKKLYMYMEKKFYTPDDALITGVKAILAEEFSRDMSKKQNNAHRRRQQFGTNAIITSTTWGYDKVGKQVVINEKEAEVVRTIYNLCLQGYGSRSIARELANQGIMSRTGKQFAEVTVRHIIRNPLFMGTVVMNKTHVDFDTKKTVRNPPEEWIYHENLVPAIVSKDTWEQANKMMDSRSQENKSNEFSKRRIGLNVGKFDLSSKIICGMCGSVYWRKYRNIKNGRVVEWYCSSYIKSGRSTKKAGDKRQHIKIPLTKLDDLGCDNRHIKETDLLNILVEVSKDIYGDKKEQIIEHATKILEEVLNKENSIDKYNKLIADKTKYLNQKNILMDKLLDGTISDNDFKTRNTDLDQRLFKIEEELIKIEEDYNKASNIKLRLENIKKYLNEESAVQDVQYLNLIKHIDKIVMYEDYFEIYFDFLKNLKVADKYGNVKYQYVDTSKYSTLHTDTYHHSNKPIHSTVHFYV
jgi:DNA invertase Pin-like site-specific DNA recombinase